MDDIEQADAPRGRWPEVLALFLRLGLTSFGGPVAHLGYFRQAVVVRRQWLTEAAYADLVALCQFLPGPASSQVGFALGLMRAGPLGALAAWTGFTLPSAILMTGFALEIGRLQGTLAQGLLHGLRLVAVAVVAQAVLGMARSLTPDARRAGIALLAVGLVTVLPAALGQIAAIGGGAVLGLWLCRRLSRTPTSGEVFPISRRVGLAALAAFLVLLFGAPLAAYLRGDLALAQFAAFYRSGALVFGGGHVVLPLLKGAVVDPGWVGQDAFLSGYGAAQAVPGPLFTFAAYLGAISHAPPGGVAGAALALVAIFLPGLLILLAALPFWSRLRALPMAQAAMRGAGAAVVGILAAALYQPVWTSAVLDPADVAAALAGVVMLAAFKWPPLVVVVLGAGYGMLKASAGF